MIFKKCVDGRCLHYSAKLPEQVTKASSYVTGTLHAIEISWVRLGNMQNNLLTSPIVGHDGGIGYSISQQSNTGAINTRNFAKGFSRLHVVWTPKFTYLM